VASKKKKGTFIFFIWATIIAAASFIFMLFYLWDSSTDTKYVSYPEFGIPIPGDYLIHGIDVSKYQQNISWDAVKEMKVREIKLGFAFIKATEGVNNTDPQFKKNWRKARQAGIIRGAYHYFIPSRDGKIQAKNFIDKVEIVSGDLPPVIDIEQTNRVSPAQLRQEMSEWLDAVELYYGVKPIIYTNAEFYKKYLQGYYDHYPLWVAHYLQPNEPRISRDWSFWQHSEQGRVNGIRAKVDFNVFNGDSLAFRSLLVP
jgi:lysozyme